MNIKALLESGDLELYVLGELPEREARAIDLLRKNYPEINQEVERIENALNAYAQVHSLTPDPHLKNKIANSLPIHQGKVVKTTFSSFRYAVAASFVLAIVSGAAAIYFYSQYQQSNTLLQALQQEQNVVASKATFLEQEVDSLQQQFNIVSNPSFKQIALAGQAFMPQAKAIVYFNPQEGKVYINTAQLPQIESNKQYQLWAIVDGKPVDLGVLEKDTSFQLMKNIKNPAAFAITLEPLGGKPEPTLSNMCVLGAVSGV